MILYPTYQVLVSLPISWHRIKTVHMIVSFYQKPFLSEYVLVLTHLRAIAAKILILFFLTFSNFWKILNRVVLRKIQMILHLQSYVYVKETLISQLTPITFYVRLL